MALRGRSVHGLAYCVSAAAWYLHRDVLLCCVPVHLQVRPFITPAALLRACRGYGYSCIPESFWHRTLRAAAIQCAFLRLAWAVEHGLMLREHAVASAAGRDSSVEVLQWAAANGLAFRHDKEIARKVTVGAAECNTLKVIFWLHYAQVSTTRERRLVISRDWSYSHWQVSSCLCSGDAFIR